MSFHKQPKYAGSIELCLSEIVVKSEFFLPYTQAREFPLETRLSLSLSILTAVTQNQKTKMLTPSEPRVRG